MIVTGPEVVAWVARQTNDFGNFGCAVGIGLEKDGALVAGVAYNEFNGPNINAHIAATESLTRPFVRAIFDYPFNQAKVNRITCLVGEGNVKSRRICLHFGFTLETQLTGAHASGNLLIYRLFRNDCRWIGLKNDR